MSPTATASNAEHKRKGRRLVRASFPRAHKRGGRSRTICIERCLSRATRNPSAARLSPPTPLHMCLCLATGRAAASSNGAPQYQH